MCKEARNVGLNFAKNKVDEQEISIYEDVMSRPVSSPKAPWIKRKKWERKYDHKDKYKKALKWIKNRRR